MLEFDSKSLAYPIVGTFKSTSAFLEGLLFGGVKLLLSFDCVSVGLVQKGNACVWSFHLMALVGLFCF